MNAPFKISSLVLLTSLACSKESPGTWSLAEVNAEVTSDNHVAVNATYVNNGQDEWGGSRCLVVEWQKGGVLNRDDARAQKTPATPIEVVETQRWCNGGNKALHGGGRDVFRAVSTHVRDQLAGTTIVVVNQDVKGTADDDRATFPSP
jgi:hypothetical protein